MLYDHTLMLLNDVPHTMLILSLYLQMAMSKNRVYLNAGSLMLNVNDKEFDESLRILGSKK